MSNCQQYFYPGVGEEAKEHLHYAQAIRVGDRVICSGQGGWKPEWTFAEAASRYPTDIATEIDNAFANVEHNLQHTGIKAGWNQVYKIVTYSTDIPSQHEHILRNLRKWCPGHYPVWTEVGVKQLGMEQMHFEIEVEAWDGEASKQK